MDTSIALEQGIIKYREEGEGPPLVFVHGLLVDGRLWRDVTPSLAGSCRLRRPRLAARRAPHRTERRR